MWNANSDGSAQSRTEAVYLKKETKKYIANEPIPTSRIITQEEYESKKQFSNYEKREIDLCRHVRKSETRKKVIRERAVMSRRTKSKIRDKVVAWYYTKLHQANGSEKKVHFNMLTLTLTEVYRDTKRVYELLNHFFTLMRKKWGVFKYIWVVEKQDGKRNGYKYATGNLHFHIIVDRYFSVRFVNKMWLSCLATAGMKTQNDKGENLNPVDIRSVGSVEVVKKYITKYITKNESEFEKEGEYIPQLWNCSLTISRLATGMYRAWSFDQLKKIYPDFDGVFTMVNEFISIHYVDKPARSYLDSLESVWRFNVNEWNTIALGVIKKVKWHIHCVEGGNYSYCKLENHGDKNQTTGKAA